MGDSVMSLRYLRRAVLALVILAAGGGVAWGIRFGLSGPKEDYGLGYDVEVTDHGTGRVTVVLTIADEGKLKPINDVTLELPGQDGSGRPDLSVAIATRDEDGARVARIHLLKSLAERAEIWLHTRGLDGKEEPLTGYFYTIKLIDQLNSAGRASQ